MLFLCLRAALVLVIARINSYQQSLIKFNLNCIFTFVTVLFFTGIF